MLLQQNSGELPETMENYEDEKDYLGLSKEQILRELKQAETPEDVDDLHSLIKKKRKVFNSLQTSERYIEDNPNKPKLDVNMIKGFWDQIPDSIKPFAAKFIEKKVKDATGKDVKLEEIMENPELINGLVEVAAPLIQGAMSKVKSATKKKEELPAGYVNSAGEEINPFQPYSIPKA